ncbi:hypothetical protein [Mycolicibacterium peregrinum]|uniref:hypothetical protein n=1 Tax=Mycolicibacterium TaxID=1866885 RepID=UPI003AAB67C0
MAVLLTISPALFHAVAPAHAEPTVDEIAPPLPGIVPTPNDWQPKFPTPYDQTRGSVTPAEIDAQREMCQWYNAQYDPLMTQIDNVNVNIVRSNGDYGVGNTQQLADAVAANIDQSVDFLTPRVQELTISQDFAGDLYFPLYQGESFYRLWQQLSNVSAGIRGRQPTWFYGPSLQHALRWGSKINRSHVCR